MWKKLKDEINKFSKYIEGSSDDNKLREMFINCFMNTLETTVKEQKDGTSYIITGDIDAMWLRDSTGQVRHYLEYSVYDKEINELILGVIRRQLMYINIDIYANAFNLEANGRGAVEDLTDMKPWIWERKYEIDSLCYPIQLSYLYWKSTGDKEIYDDYFKETVKRIIALWKLEQNHKRSPYSFQRFNCPETDTLTNEGKGAEVEYTGMTWSGFRPSDDRCIYGYLVPSNMFAVVVLKYVEEIADVIFKDMEFRNAAEELRKQIDEGIKKYAVVKHKDFGNVYAYEVDGFGNYILMDDANVPSLLSIPYIGYSNAEDEIYRNTRKMLLSKTNPYFKSGKFAKGIGSPHTQEGYIWPMSLIMQGLTAQDPFEVKELIEMLLKIDDDTKFIHESINPDDPSEYTRSWFAWANSLFAELILKTYGRGLNDRS